MCNSCRDCVRGSVSVCYNGSRSNKVISSLVPTLSNAFLHVLKITCICNFRSEITHMIFYFQQNEQPWRIFRGIYSGSWEIRRRCIESTDCRNWYVGNNRSSMFYNRSIMGLKWSNSSKGDWKPELHEDQVEYEQEW